MARKDDLDLMPALLPSTPTAQAGEKTMVDYLSHAQHGFDVEPFNPVDSLVLSSLVYLDFDLVDFDNPSGTKPVPLIDILRFIPTENLIATSWLKNANETPEFLSACAKSRRYRDLGVCLYAKEQSDSIDKQFAAATFTCSGMEPYVAFRGTDGSVVGWKEDFALSYKDVIPSQRSAGAYLSGVASFFTDEHLRVGGHSKGGNLAEYAVATLHKDVFPRIEAVYNHDGPNFLNPPSPRYLSNEYQTIRHKYVPESSIFGMLLEDSVHLHYVASNAVSFFQHRPLSWLVGKRDFVYRDDQSQSAQFFDEALDSWLRSCSVEQRDAFLTTIFELVEETDCKSWSEFQRKLPQNLAKVLKGTRNLDAQTKEAIYETLTHLGQVLKSMTQERMQGALGRFFRNENRAGTDTPDGDADAPLLL